MFSERYSEVVFNILYHSACELSAVCPRSSQTIYSRGCEMCLDIGRYSTQLYNGLFEGLASVGFQ